jgi:dihydrofolate reductase
MSESTRPRIVLVAALARDRTIGKGGSIPWRHPEDLRHFKAVTMGTVVVMGRKTYDSIGRPLPGRATVVVTRSPAQFASAHPDVTAVGSFDSAIAWAADHGAKVVSVAGGAEIYAQALPLADEMILTHVPEPGGGDAL